MLQGQTKSSRSFNSNGVAFKVKFSQGSVVLQGLPKSSRSFIPNFLKGKVKHASQNSLVNAQMIVCPATSHYADSTILKSMTTNRGSVIRLIFLRYRIIFPTVRTVATTVQVRYYKRWPFIYRGFATGKAKRG